jgi:hypothetical protein
MSDVKGDAKTSAVERGSLRFRLKKSATDIGLRLKEGISGRYVLDEPSIKYKDDQKGDTGYEEDPRRLAYREYLPVKTLASIHEIVEPMARRGEPVVLWRLAVAEVDAVLAQYQTTLHQPSGTVLKFATLYGYVFISDDAFGANDDDLESGDTFVALPPDTKQYRYVLQSAIQRHEQTIRRLFGNNWVSSLKPDDPALEFQLYPIMEQSGRYLKIDDDDYEGDDDWGMYYLDNDDPILSNQIPYNELRKAHSRAMQRALLGLPVVLWTVNIDDLEEGLPIQAYCRTALKIDILNNQIVFGDNTNKNFDTELNLGILQLDLLIKDLHHIHAAFPANLNASEERADLATGSKQLISSAGVAAMSQAFSLASHDDQLIRYLRLYDAACGEDHNEQDTLEVILVNAVDKLSRQAAETAMTKAAKTAERDWQEKVIEDQAGKEDARIEAQGRISGMWTLSCDNDYGLDLISGDPLNSYSDWADIVTILSKTKDGWKKNCFRRADLIYMMQNRFLWKWIPWNSNDPSEGKADRDTVYYLIYPAFYVGQESLDLIKSRWPRWSVFRIEFVKKELVGTAHGISRVHGQVVEVHTLVPLKTREQMLIEQKIPLPPQQTIIVPLTRPGMTLTIPSPMSVTEIQKPRPPPPNMPNFRIPTHSFARPQFERKTRSTPAAPPVTTAPMPSHESKQPPPRPTDNTLYPAPVPSRPALSSSSVPPTTTSSAQTTTSSAQTTTSSQMDIDRTGGRHRSQQVYQRPPFTRNVKTMADRTGGWHRAQQLYRPPPFARYVKTMEKTKNRK